MSLYFEFNSQLQIDMKNIYMNLKRDNAIKLVFDNTKQATKSGTNIISADGNVVNNDYKFSESKKIIFTFYLMKILIVNMLVKKVMKKE